MDDPIKEYYYVMAAVLGVLINARETLVNAYQAIGSDDDAAKDSLDQVFTELQALAHGLNTQGRWSVLGTTPPLVTSPAVPNLDENDIQHIEDVTAVS